MSPPPFLWPIVILIGVLVQLLINLSPTIVFSLVTTPLISWKIKKRTTISSAPLSKLNIVPWPQPHVNSFGFDGFSRTLASSTTTLMQPYCDNKVAIPSSTSASNILNILPPDLWKDLSWTDLNFSCCFGD